MTEAQEATLAAAGVLWGALATLLKDPAVRLAFADFAWERGVLEIPYSSLQDWIAKNTPQAGAEVTLDLAVELAGVRVRLVGLDAGGATLHLTDAPGQAPPPSPLVGACYLPLANVGADAPPVSPAAPVP